MALAPQVQSFTIPSGLSLGMNSAEADDEYLLHCFIKTLA